MPSKASLIFLHKSRKSFDHIFFNPSFWSWKKEIIQLSAAAVVIYNSAIHVEWITSQSTSEDLPGKLSEVKGLSMGQLYTVTPAEHAEQTGLALP